MMQCLADDPASLYSAARAHSTLHQAAVLVDSIKAHLHSREKVDSLQLYVNRLAWKYSKHLRRIEVQFGPKSDIGRVMPVPNLSGADELTHLCLAGFARFNPADLAGKMRLQVLRLGPNIVIGGARGIKQLLLQLQELKQLVYLELAGSQLEDVPGWKPAGHSLAGFQPAPDVPGLLDGVDIPAVVQGLLMGLTSQLLIGLKSQLDWVELPTAAYSALTASSNLQHLKLQGCALPEDPWELLFPDGKQLPHLRSLDISRASAPRGRFIPESSRLASCCPGLQHLDMSGLECSVEELRLLSQLPNLTRLTFHRAGGHLREALAATCRNIVWE
jgi:hypothetical protein